MEHESACRIVWNILKGMPIEVFDEDEGSIWENDTYELVRPRTEGDFEGTRAIGSANIVTALNMINQKIYWYGKENYGMVKEMICMDWRYVRH